MEGGPFPTGGGASCGEMASTCPAPATRPMWTGSHVNTASREPQEALSTSRHPRPRLPGNFRRPPPPEGGARRGPRGGRAERPLPSAPYRAHAALHPGAREQSPRPRHARPTPRTRDPGAGATAPARPAEPFRLARSSADVVRYPPCGRAPGTCLGSRGPHTAAAGEPPQPPQRPEPLSGPRGAGPHRRPAAPRAGPREPRAGSPPPPAAAADTRAPARRPPVAALAAASRPPVPSRDSQARPRTGPVLGEGM